MAAIAATASVPTARTGSGESCVHADGGPSGAGGPGRDDPVELTTPVNSRRSPGSRPELDDVRSPGAVRPVPVPVVQTRRRNARCGNPRRTLAARMIAYVPGMGLRVVIIGAGFGGLGRRARPARAGIDDVTSSSAADEVGGVWRDNTYPGRPATSRRRSTPGRGRPTRPGAAATPASRRSSTTSGAPRAGEGLLDLVRTGTDVTALEYVDGCWRVTTNHGVLEADLVVCATGQLSNPVVPAVPGADTFAGPVFHSAQWRHDVDLTGKRVAVVGTGASAIQFVPGIVDRVGSMTVFQRSAPYVRPEAGPRLHEPPPPAVREVPVGARGRAAADVLDHRAVQRRPRGHLPDHPAADGDAPRDRGSCSCAARSATPSCAASWCRTTSSAASGCCSPTTGTPRSTATTSTWSPSGSPRSSRAGCAPPTAPLHEADVLIWGTGFAATDFLGGLDVRGVDGPRSRSCGPTAPAPTSA